MLDYKKLLGDKYKDGLSDTELLALLNELNLADLSSGEYVAKGKFDARESEIANLKKAIASVTGRNYKIGPYNPKKVQKAPVDDPLDKFEDSIKRNGLE